MAGGWGGRRAGAGRKRGSTQRKTAEIAEKVVASGRKTPLEYLIDVLNDESAELHRRDAAARDAAPFMHARLLATPHNVLPTGRNELLVTHVTLVGIPSGQNHEGRPFNFDQSTPRLVRPVIEAVPIEEIVDDEPEPEPPAAAPEGPPNPPDAA